MLGADGPHASEYTMATAWEPRSQDAVKTEDFAEYMLTGVARGDCACMHTLVIAQESRPPDAVKMEHSTMHTCL